MLEFDTTFRVTLRANEPLSLGQVKQLLETKHKVVTINKLDCAEHKEAFRIEHHAADFIGDQERVISYP